MRYIITYCNRQEELLHILTSKRCIEILYAVSREDHTATSLAEYLEISVPTISYYLKILSRAEIIDMQPCFDDLRVKNLSLSDRGRMVLFMYDNKIIFDPVIVKS